MDQYAERALTEYNNKDTSPHPGGVSGRPFWNINASQFTFVPTLQFPAIPRGKSYRFTAVDCKGVKHSFTNDAPTASLAPVWSEIPPGFVHLTVQAINKNGVDLEISGTRVFYKSAPFPGRNCLPNRATSYRECARKALSFAYEDPMVQHWLIHGLPDPDYAHNAYPAKMISSVIEGMVSYAKLEPKNSENALRLACRAADYMLSISFDANHPLAFLPPTYSFLNMNAESVHKVAPAAWGCQGTTMMIYPAYAGLAYLTLTEATGNKKYFDAALRIAEYYKKTVLPCGSWHLLLDCNSGKPLTNNICVNFNLVTFFNRLYKKTGDESWHDLETGCYRYISEVCMKTYNWEGQFEDVKVSGNYLNLTHFTAGSMIEYIAENLSDDENMVSEAVDLMRFVEDQFVVWGEFPCWDPDNSDRIYHTPAGLEQYFCYVPIDSSTATIMNDFMKMYQLKKDRLYLEKAMALGDVITRKQNKETGMIPTFWIGENCAEGYRNYWINCQIHTAKMMFLLADLTESENIE